MARLDYLNFRHSPERIAAWRGSIPSLAKIREMITEYSLLGTCLGS